MKQTHMITDVFQFSEEQRHGVVMGLQNAMANIMVALQQKDAFLPKADGIMFGSCEQKFDLCPFFNVCAATNDEAREAMLANNYACKAYDPFNIH